MKKSLIVFFILIGYFSLNAQPTITTVAVDEWAAIAQNDVRKGAAVYVGGSYSAILHIATAITSTISHDGMTITPQVFTGDNWSDLLPYTSETGTANPEPYAANASADDVGIQMGSTTGYLADEMIFIFTLDNTVASSELHKLVSHVANDSVIVLDGLENAHTNADTVFNIASYRTYSIPLADSVRILYDNTFDVNGSPTHSFSRLTKLTGI